MSVTCLQKDLRLKWLDEDDSDVADEVRAISEASDVDDDGAAAGGDAKGDRNSSTFS